MTIFGIYVNLFFLGALGSIAVEVAVLVGHYRVADHLPSKFKTFGFYVSQLALECDAIQLDR